jgi:DNA-binding LacI/PurR family transcriptional regulator
VARVVRQVVVLHAVLHGGSTWRTAGPWQGLRVPDDVSVVGFDDLPEARWATPGLTTVRQPLSEMAATALRLLVRLMAGDQPEGTRTELSTRLVERASTAAPRA